MTKANSTILMDYNFPEIHITEETRKEVLTNPEKYSGCDIRIRMGLFRTEKEQKAYLEKSLAIPLPGTKKSVFTRIRKK